VRYFNEFYSRGENSLCIKSKALPPATPGTTEERVWLPFVDVSAYLYKVIHQKKIVEVDRLIAAGTGRNACSECTGFVHLVEEEVHSARALTLTLTLSLSSCLVIISRRCR